MSTNFVKKQEFAHIGTNTGRVNVNRIDSSAASKQILIFIQDLIELDIVEQPNPVSTRYCSYSNLTLHCNS